MTGAVIADAPDGVAVVDATAAAIPAALPTDPAEAQAEIARTYGDATHPYARGDQAASDRMMALFNTVNPAMVDGDVSQAMIDAVRTVEAPGAPPEDPDAYPITRLEVPRPRDGSPERDITADLEVVRELRTIAHEGGLTVDEWQNLVSAYNDHGRIWSRSPDDQRFASVVAEIGQMTDTRLREEWGADYSRNLATVRAFTRARGERFVDILETTGLGNDLRTVRAVLTAAQRRKAA